MAVKKHRIALGGLQKTGSRSRNVSRPYLGACIFQKNKRRLLIEEKRGGSGDAAGRGGGGGFYVIVASTLDGRSSPREGRVGSCKKRVTRGPFLLEKVYLGEEGRKEGILQDRNRTSSATFGLKEQASRLRKKGGEKLPYRLWGTVKGEKLSIGNANCRCAMGVRRAQNGSKE